MERSRMAEIAEATAVAVCVSIKARLFCVDCHQCRLPRLDTALGDQRSISLWQKRCGTIRRAGQIISDNADADEGGLVHSVDYNAMEGHALSI